jgi:hypothetical protein
MAAKTRLKLVTRDLTDDRPTTELYGLERLRRVSEELQARCMPAERPMLRPIRGGRDDG